MIECQTYRGVEAGPKVELLSEVTIKYLQYMMAVDLSKLAEVVMLSEVRKHMYN